MSIWLAGVCTGWATQILMPDVVVRRVAYDADRSIFCNHPENCGTTLTDSSKLVMPRDAAKVLGISYSTLKRWIHTAKIKTVRTKGGHHRIPATEIDRYLHVPGKKISILERRAHFRRISARNQLIGRIVDIKIDGIMAQVTLSIGGQSMTSIITADAVREMRLEVGQVAAALIKSTEVMILRV